MSFATIAAPGTEFGPCAEPCEHTDCAATRRTAEALCNICGEPIGYDRRYYSDDPGGYVHALCAEEQALSS